jgi:hypothetical protein
MKKEHKKRTKIPVQEVEPRRHLYDQCAMKIANLSRNIE